MAATAEAPTVDLNSPEISRQLASQWRSLRRAATAVAVLTSPAAFTWLHAIQGWSLLWSLVGTFLLVIAFRGLVDSVQPGQLGDAVLILARTES